MIKKNEVTGLVEVKTVMYSKVDIDFDNPDEEKIKKLVKDDFAHKVLVLFLENLYNLPSDSPHCFMYQLIEDRWYNKFTPAITYQYKEFEKLTNFDDNLDQYIQEYIADYMAHSYVGRGVQVPTKEEICSWCGGGEFPFLEPYIVKNEREDGHVNLCYYLSR